MSRRLRVFFGDSCKILVVRDNTLPDLSYDAFLELLVQKVPYLVTAATTYIILLSHHGMPITNDKDIHALWSTPTQSMDIVVELEEPTEETSHLLWDRERAKKRRLSMAQAALPSPQSPLTLSYPPSTFGTSTYPASTLSYPASTLHFPTGAPGTELSRSSSRTETLSAESSRSGGSGRSTISRMPANSRKDVLTVNVGKTEYEFPMFWTTPPACTAHELMGALGKEPWAQQRNSSYAQGNWSDKDKSVTYKAQKGGMAKMFSSNTRFIFTVFFDDVMLYEAAKVHYPKNLASLTLGDFISYLVSTLPPRFESTPSGEKIPIGTDWCCMQPPSEFQDETPVGGFDYHVVYVVKRSDQPALSSAGKETLFWWLKTMMIAGLWASEKARKNMAW